MRSVTLALVLVLVLAFPAAIVASPRQSLAPTLSLVEIAGEQVPFQNGEPLRSFDPQDSPRISLAGAWRKLRTHADHNLTMSQRDPEALRALQASGYFAPELDDTRWRQATVPGVENRMPDPGSTGTPERYEDGVWYRRRVTVPEDWKGRFVTLNFLAVNYVADVWLNGRYVGYHEGGYTPFSFDVSSLLVPGAENLIAVRVDNPPWGSRQDTVPAAARSDWWNYTGIVQDVYLESQPLLHVVRADAVPASVEGATSVRVILSNAGSRPTNVSLRVRFFEANPAAPGYLTDPRASSIEGKEAAVQGQASEALALAPGETRAVRLAVSIVHPKTWSPDHPALYVLSAELLDDGTLVDRWCTQFGIRTVGTIGPSIVVNGAPVILAGVARHEEWPDTGRTASWERILADLQIVKELGANFLRTAHYPNHPDTYILADRLGLLVMEEIPAWQLTAAELEVQSHRLILDQMWREMIFSSFDRPSVVLWGTENECREETSRERFMRRVISDWRANYPDGRLVTQSAAADSPGPSDESQADCDVAGWTMYFGTFHGSTPYAGTAAFLDKAHARFPEAPVLATEFGLWSLPNDRNLDEQRTVFRETFKAFRERLAGRNGGFVVGMTWWTLFDWFSVNTGIQRMGLAKMDRVSRKPVWQDVKDAYEKLLGGQ